MPADYSDQGDESTRVPTNADGSPMTRGQMKEACRLAYCSGRAKLTELCCRYQLPYDTLRRWSVEDAWSVTKEEVAKQADSGTVSALAEWLLEQRMRQIRGSIVRAGRLQSEIDKVLDAGNPLCPKDLQSIATAEERADLIARRNLGLDQPGQAGPLVNVNALAGITLT